MSEGKHGIQVFDDTGMPILEIGPHIIREAPQFAQKIGVIAATWAQAEVNLNCLFAILLDTTPDEAEKHLKKCGTAVRATKGARKIAADTLTGAELTSVQKTLDELDLVRARRNRVQHDVWAKKGSDNQTIYAVHSDQYLAFTTQLLAVAELEKAEGENSDRAIILAREFSTSISHGYTIKDLENIDLEIDRLSKSLLSVMFSRITLRPKGE